MFASRELGLLAERNLIAVAPVLFLGFGLWLDRGGPGPLLVRALAATAVAVAIVLLPLRKLVVPDALPHAFTLIPLWHLRELTSAGTTRLTVALAVVAAAALFALVPRRALVVLPALLFVALAAGSVSASREVADQARAQQQRLLGPVRRWVDDAADGPTAYVYDGQAYWNAVWENLFWNRRIRTVYDLPGTRVPGPLPQTTLVVGPRGELLPDGKPSDAAFAIVPLHIALRGEKVAESPQVGTDRRGLGLWRLDRPLRLDTITSGLFENGDVDREASLTAYDCRAGTFEADLLVKAPQTVSVFVNGRLVRRTAYPSATTAQVSEPASAENAEGTCKLRIVSDGLLGTTRFTYAPPVALLAPVLALRAVAVLPSPASACARASASPCARPSARAPWRRPDAGRQREAACGARPASASSPAASSPAPWRAPCCGGSPVPVVATAAMAMPAATAARAAAATGTSRRRRERGAANTRVSAVGSQVAASRAASAAAEAGRCSGRDARHARIADSSSARHAADQGARRSDRVPLAAQHELGEARALVRPAAR